MEQRIRDRFSPEILEETTARYGLTPNQLIAKDGFESFIYEYERDGNGFILRIAHSIRRSEAMVRGEIDWINFLADGGAGVARAVQSARDYRVERIDDGAGGYFLATAFHRARGKPAWEVGWSEPLYRTYGRLMGNLHGLTRSYVPGDPRAERFNWDSSEMLEVEQFLPRTETMVRDNYRRLLEKIHVIPQNGDSYGLIHQDAHAGNFFVSDTGEITLFDFDDCAYSWFINDIAIVLFYMINGMKNPREFLDTFLPPFLEGYCLETRFDPTWIEAIPLFLKLREIDLYAVIHRSFNVENLEDPWCRRFMTGRRERLMKNHPFVDFDFTVIRKWIS